VSIGEKKERASMLPLYFLPTYIPYPKYLNKPKILLGKVSASFVNLLQAGLFTNMYKYLHHALMKSKKSN